MNLGHIIRQRYRIDRILGKGSMGTTYKAFDVDTRSAVAVKLLHFSRIRDWKVLEMFEREARILQQLDHPRIPSYIDYFALDSDDAIGGGPQFVLVQEYIEGKPLQYLVEKGWRGTEAEILDLFRQLINILAYLHTLNPPVIHRDINPKNILLSPLNEVFLVDFGAVQERIRTTFLGGSTIVGTYGYVPFEQFSGHTVPASDYYALGATLLYLLSHRDPADFPAEDMKPQFHDVLHVSPRVLRLLDGLLEPSVKQRVASPDQIRAILDGPASAPFATRASRIPQPPWSKIERIDVGPQALRFRIPKRLMKIIPGQATLDLTADTVKFLDAYKIGKKLGQSWTLSTPDLRPSDVTWYYEHNTPVVGINARGMTYVISASLALAEIRWLVQELRDFVARVRLALLPDATRKMVEASHAEPLFLPVIAPEMPPNTRIQRSGDAVNSLTLRVPRRILPPSLTPQSTFQRELLEFFELFLGRRTLELSPAWLLISTTIFGLKIGRAYQIPTASIRPADITCFFEKIAGDGDSSLRRLVVGLNHGERTLKLAGSLTTPEADWLVHELSRYIAQYAASITERGADGDG